ACRRLHQEAYVTAFDAATHVVLPPVGRTDLKEEEKLDVPRLCVDLLARQIGGKPLESVHLPNTDAIVSYLAALVEPGDTIAVLSNGAFGGIHRKLLAALEESLPETSLP